MTTTPTVTIRVGGVPVSVATTAVPDGVSVSEDNLFMTYFQATKGEERRQWIVFPPAVAGFGIPDTEVGVERVLVLSRTQKFAGNRSKWFTGFSFSPHTSIINELNLLSSRGYELGGTVVAPLEADDYLSVYTNTTSHKAIRAIDRALNAVHDISVK